MQFILIYSNFLSNAIFLTLLTNHVLGLVQIFSQENAIFVGQK